jgi:hypothetical protein
MIKTTTDYAMFTLMEENRDIDLSHRKTKNLAASMMQHGWLSAFPAMVKRSGKKLILIDGQHRFSVAREYGIPVKYVVEDRDIDVARLNDTSKSWTIIDYAKKYAKAGKSDYIELLEFYYSHTIPLSWCISALASTINFSNEAHRFYEGRWKIKSRPMAMQLVRCYEDLCEAAPQLKKSSCIRALWMCLYVPYFDQSRLIAGAHKLSATIRRPTDYHSALDVFEQIYNHGRKERKPLSFDAARIARERSAAQKKEV